MHLNWQLRPQASQFNNNQYKINEIVSDFQLYQTIYKDRDALIHIKGACELIKTSHILIGLMKIRVTEPKALQ